MTVLGEVSEADAENGSFENLLTERHPYLKGFIRDADNAIMIVTVREVIVAGFSETQRLIID